jgi:hypothetical protein
MKSSSVILACLLITTACSKVNELDKRTQNMEKSTEKVSTVTDEMKDTTSTMYQQIRSKEAEDTRDEKFQILMGKEADFGTRITAAGVYFKSMEFQLHTDNGDYDTDKNLNEFYIDAANEFTRRMCDLYEKIHLDKMSPTKNNKMDMSFYALSVAIHMNHSFHDLVAKSEGKEALSMYDLVKNALIKDKNGKRLREHEEILLNGINKEILIELIKARVDMLSALALKNLTDKRDMTLGQKAKALLFKVSGGRWGDIDLPEVYDKSNEATKIYTEKYLDGAVKAKQFLVDIGVEKQLEKTVKSALKGIDLNESEDSGSTSKDLDMHRQQIKAYIVELLK